VLDLFLTAFCIITLIVVFLNPCGASSKREHSKALKEASSVPLLNSHPGLSVLQARRYSTHSFWSSVTESSFGDWAQSSTDPATPSSDLPNRLTSPKLALERSTWTWTTRRRTQRGTCADQGVEMAIPKSRPGRQKDRRPFSTPVPSWKDSSSSRRTDKGCLEPGRARLGTRRGGMD
jgi:hypothetical protein